MEEEWPSEWLEEEWLEEEWPSEWQHEEWLGGGSMRCRFLKH